MDGFDSLVRILGLSTLAGYRYVRRLAESGQAAACLYQNEAGQKVVIKISITPGNDARRRLAREAEALQQCARAGDSIVKGLTLIQQHLDLPIHYFIMEFSPGTPLESLIADERQWYWRRALQVVGRTAWALIPAHAMGYVHRDLHPGNIMVDDASFRYSLRDDDDDSPGVFILDFGVQRNVYDGLFDDGPSLHLTFRPVGAVSYASPEALKTPNEVAQMSDMWSLGVVLYRLLTGELPFFEKSLQALIARVQEGRIPSAKFLGACPMEQRLLETALARLVHPSPAARMSIRGLTAFARDMLLLDLANVGLGDKFYELYFAADGDLYTCINCRMTVMPNGSRCRACGMMNNDWLRWDDGEGFLPFT